MGRNKIFIRKRWKKLEKNNVTIALNVLYVKKMHPAYVSKHNSNREKQIILLMVTNEEKLWYFNIML